MAIDTAEKRRSAAHVGSRRGPGVTPNALKDAEWRQQAGWGYSGIAVSAPAADPGSSPIILDPESWERIAPADARWSRGGPGNVSWDRSGPSDERWSVL